MIPPTALRVTASIRNCMRMSRPRAPDGQTNPDFTGAFGDAHEHDVHDPDAADHQRDAGHRAKKDRHDAGSGGETIRDLLLGLNHEIIVLAVADAMALPEQFGDLILHIGELVGTGRLGEQAEEGRLRP